LCDGAQIAIFDDFFRPVFAASPVQHVSDLRRLRLGEEKKKTEEEEETTGQKYNGLPYYIGRL